MRAFLLLIACLAWAVPGRPQQPASDRRLQRVERWLDSPDASLRVQAVRELAALERPESKDLLLRALRDSHSEVRGVAAWSLKAYRDPAVVAVLRGVLRDENDRVRAAAAWALSSIGDKSVLPEIMKMAQEDPAPVARFRAVWGLAFFRDRTALPVAIRALTDINTSVRERAALLALEALRDPTVPERLRALANHPYTDTRRIVMYLLAKYPARENIPVLQTALEDPEPVVRGEAALSLGKIKSGSSRDKLIATLRDDDDHVRGAAAYALGLIGDKASLPALQQIPSDESAFVRALAAESRNRLGDTTVKPPAGFRGAELFTYPVHSPEHTHLY